MSANLTPKQRAAVKTVHEVLAKYQIRGLEGAARLLRERATQADLERYQNARDYLDHTGAIG